VKLQGEEEGHRVSGPAQDRGPPFLCPSERSTGFRRRPRSKPVEGRSAFLDFHTKPSFLRERARWGTGRGIFGYGPRPGRSGPAVPRKRPFDGKNRHGGLLRVEGGGGTLFHDDLWGAEFVSRVGRPSTNRAARSSGWTFRVDRKHHGRGTENVGPGIQGGRAMCREWKNARVGICAV